MTNDWSVGRAAEHLLLAEAERRDIHRVTDDWSALDLPTAYLVQDEIIARKQAEGHVVVGVKLGLTSVAKQQRMGIDAPLTAVITDRMRRPVGAPIEVAEFIHPRIEPEIVFVMGEDLRGPGVTRESALAAVAEVRAGFEVIDSRYIDFSFALPDVVADNASSAAYVIGDDALDPAALDLAAEECVVLVDDVEVDRATGAAVQGHPADALALAANSLAERGRGIRAGDLVLTGGLTDAVFVHPGSTYSAVFTNLGRIDIAAA